MLRARLTVPALCGLTLILGCGGDPLGAGPSPPGKTGGGSGVGGMGSATDSGTGTTAGTGSGSGTGFSCGEVELALRVNAPNVVLVLDRSGSMSFPWDHDANPGTPDSTRWDSLLDAVDLLIGEFGADMRMGALVFPSVGSMEGCDVSAGLDVPISDAGGQALLDLLGQASAYPAGGTPAAAALAVATDDLAGQAEDAPRVIVLVTDGLPSCGETMADAVSAVEAARSKHGVFTSAVGVGVDPAAVPAFQALAAAGGATEVFFNGTNEDELVDALRDVAGDVIRCRVPIPIPDMASHLTLNLDGQELPALETCGDEPGWAFVDPGGTLDTIEICSATCDMLTETSDLLAIYSCPPSTPGP